MPAPTKRRFGSSNISEALGTTAWPLLSKNVSQRRLISAVSIVVFLTLWAGPKQADQHQGYAGFAVFLPEGTPGRPAGRGRGRFGP